MSPALALAVVAACGELTVTDARARADLVQSLVVEEHESYRTWQAVWVTAMAAGMVGQGAMANVTEERGQRAALLVGAAKATVGLVAVLTMPEPRLPVAWPKDACQRLRVAEAALTDLHRAQEASRALWRHAGSFLLNLGATLFVGLAHDEWLLGLSSGLLGAAVGQAILRTRPDGALDTLPLSVGVGAGGLALEWHF